MRGTEVELALNLLRDAALHQPGPAAVTDAVLTVAAQDYTSLARRRGPLWAALAQLPAPLLRELGMRLTDMVGALPVHDGMVLISRVLELWNDDVRTQEAVEHVLIRLSESDELPHSGMRLVSWLARLGAVPVQVLAYARRRMVLNHGITPELAELAKNRGRPVLNPGEPWTDQALSELAGMARGRAQSWENLLRHTLTLSSARPTKKWRAEARELLDALGADEVFSRSDRWLDSFSTAPPRFGDPYNDNAMRGLLWLRAIAPEEGTSARLLGAVVEGALVKESGSGPRSAKVANTAAHVLSTMDSEAALAELARLAGRVTYKVTLKQLDKALQEKADALGITRGEIEELAVPRFGLTEVGRCTQDIGDASVELVVEPGGVRTHWRGANGKPVKSVPAAVRRDYAEDLSELRVRIKDIDKMLAAQKTRLDRLFLAHRVWRFDEWRVRYLDHPLVGTLARRLIWTVGVTPCAYYEGELRGLDGQPVHARIEDDVALWHPIDHHVDEVLEWRELLTEQGVVQPFKQAHREIYPLTEAERETAGYSNRFAAHILKQHQFHSLAAVRGWNNRLRLMVDDSYPPAVLELPEWGLRAEFWIEGLGEDFETAATDSGSYRYVGTDQVRFYPLQAPESIAHSSGGGYAQWVAFDEEITEPLPLTAVPPLVLSEVLRDVDLFVGVASIGNDPAWQDGGADTRYQEYWNSYGFGELSMTAQTRRELLRRLVPRLAIAGRCTVTDRFLEVRGDLRTYRIHLGSGNILMTPNDQYLCIVPRQAKDVGDPVRLPFEGERTLSLILSKAFLLAADTEITDPSITQQLRL